MKGMLFSKVLHMSLIGCYSFFIVLLVRIFLKKIAHKYCYYLWLIVFLNLCIPISFFSSFSLIPKQIQNFTLQREKSLDNTSKRQTNDEYSEIILIRDSGTQIYGKNYHEMFADESLENTEYTENVSEAAPFQWKQLLLLAERIWLLGIFGFMIYSIYSAVKLNIQLKKSEKRYIDREYLIVESSGIDTPFLWGAPPKIYLPTDMEAEEQKYIIEHEKYHRKRKDYLIKIIIYAITILHWFNPLVWLSYNLCCKDMEISCDEIVLDGADLSVRKKYAHSLLKYAAKQNRYVITPLTFGEPSVRSRIKNVLKYKKRGIVISVIAVLVTIFIAVGLFARSKEIQNEAASIESTDKTVGKIRLPIVNNGGEIIKVGSNFYYKEGRAIYSNGTKIYTTNTKNPENIDYIFEYDLSGSGFNQLIQGTLVGISESNNELYFLREEDDGEQSFCVFDTYSMDIHQVYKSASKFLTVADGCVYSYRKDVDGIYLEINQIDASYYEEHLLELPSQVEEITCMYANKNLIFSAGKYEGSAGYFYGDFYIYDTASKNIVKQIHLTDAAEFYVFEDFIYYQKYLNDTDKGNDLYRTDFDLSKEEFIGEKLELIKVEESGTILAAKDGQLLRVSSDGRKQEVIFDLIKDIGWTLADGKKAKFTELNIIENHIFVKAELWGYVKGNGWRDSLISSDYFKINIDGSSYSTWNPQDIIDEFENRYDYLYDRLPGSHVADPVGAGWNMDDIEDIRGIFTSMGSIPEEGTEEKTYLLGKTDSYTLYGKGDFNTMLLECAGKYSEINYPYTSGRMTPLDLLESDFDKDGREELAIKFNIKHGTGISIDTLLMADLEANDKLYTYQFLEEDFISQLQEHLSYKITENGIYAYVDGKQAGTHMDDNIQWSEVTIGNFVSFEYVEQEIMINADLLFHHDNRTYGVPLGNGTAVSATIVWNENGEFVLKDFKSIDTDSYNFEALSEEEKQELLEYTYFSDIEDKVTADDVVNLRDIPSQDIDSTVLRQLKNGEIVTRTGISDTGWSRLVIDGETYYAVTSYLTTDLEYRTPDENGNGGLKTQFATVSQKVTPKIEVNLRKLPSVTNPDATVMATAKAGEVFIRTGISQEHGWSRVEYQDQTLYCVSSYIEIVE